MLGGLPGSGLSKNKRDASKSLRTAAFIPLEIMLGCPPAGLDFRIIPAGFNALMEFLMGLICEILAFHLLEMTPLSTNIGEPSLKNRILRLLNLTLFFTRATIATQSPWGRVRERVMLLS
jgi:hypothetical protein